MIRRLAATAVVLLVGSTLTADAVPDTWGERADDLIVRAIAADDGTGGPLEYGTLTLALGGRRGWDDPDTLTYLDTLLDLQHADGGFGLGYPFDAFGDGTVNPAGTAYLVSMAGHAGPALLAAHVAGVTAVDGPLQAMIDKMWTFTRFYAPATPGRCLAYSDQPADRICVHNVNAGAAAFLVQAWDAGVGTVNPSYLAAAITQHEAASYQLGPRNWAYSNRSGGLQDPAHMAYSVGSMMTLAPGLARNPVDYQLTKTGTDWRWPYAHAWLAAYNCGLGAAWMADFDGWADRLTGLSLLAQAAAVAAVAAKACD